MNDQRRDLIIRRSAYGFLGCVCLLLIVGMIFGKANGRVVLLSVLPLYAIYYVVMYWALCRRYQDEVKRISAFGIPARGTFVGVIFYVCLYLVVSGVFLGVFVLMN